MASLSDFNGVHSTIVDKGTNPPVTGISPNSTFIFGTATKGPVGTPVPVRGDQIHEVFGYAPLDSSFDTSLVRGFHEFADASRNNPEVVLIRVGDVNAATINLYEHEGYLSGNLMATLVTEDGITRPSYSLAIRALTEGAEYNKAKVQVEADDNGFPSYLSVELPDGTKVGYTISPASKGPGVINRVSDLVALINSNQNFAGKIQASYTPLSVTTDLTVTANASGVVDTTYQLTAPNDESWGNKLVSVRKAYVSQTISGEIDGGSLTAELPVIPEKVMDEGSPTLDDFYRVSSLEGFLTVTPLQAGTSGVEKHLYCASTTGWDNSYAIDGSGDSAWEIKVYVRRSGSTNMAKLTKDTDYTVNTTTGTITILETLTVGDAYFASYRYKVAYTEAKRRSQLQDGNDRQYFIFGDEIIFGGEQPTDLIVVYSADVEFDSSEVSIISKDDAIIEFLNTTNMPSVGGTISLTIAYEPELPAATGSVLSGPVVQPGSLSGGSDGRINSKKAYKKAVEAALKSVDLYPRRHNIIMGMYLDDVESGYNAETGLAEDIPVLIHGMVLPYIERSSNLANECDVSIPVRPLTDLSQASINEWILKLTVNSDSDLNRSANLIDGIQSFRAEAPVGSFIVSNPNLNNGRPYFANPATIYTAFKGALPFDQAAVHQHVPGSVQDLGVKIFNAETINMLNAKRYSAAVLNPAQEFIWADAPTLAPSGRSQFDRQFVRDTVYLAVSFAREVAEKYIGKPRLPQYQMSLKKDIYKALMNLVPEVLADLYVELVPTVDGNITGRTKVRLILVTAKEIRAIDLETTISLAE